MINISKRAQSEPTFRLWCDNSTSDAAEYLSEARRPWGRRTVVRRASNPTCKNKSARETPANTLSQQALNIAPATRADMPSMEVKGQTRKEAFQHKEQKKTNNKLVKTAARNDKKTCLEDKAPKAQEAAFRGDIQTLYRITRDLTRTATRQQSKMNT
ncbi:hypothetical protein ElyMa_003364300 [Elysia marginata]|uniref:Uncharacterized protein n=1 Tax=Elysia marginata TaxID=1093978 RepID=A0AAV4JI22_9GAST|nr:hypothetical protein ElyMa_003364300 [Elysia marginata]